MSVVIELRIRTRPRLGWTRKKGKGRAGGCSLQKRRIAGRVNQKIVQAGSLESCCPVDRKPESWRRYESESAVDRALQGIEVVLVSPEDAFFRPGSSDRRHLTSWTVERTRSWTRTSSSIPSSKESDNRRRSEAEEKCNEGRQATLE